MELLKQLSESPGVSGREERVRALIQKQVQQHVDEMVVDEMGNLVCFKSARKNPSLDTPPPKVMVSCHMDEIGFYVRSIDKNGFLRIKALGGFDPRNLLARQVLVQGKNDLYGLLNANVPPIHIAKPEEKTIVPSINQFYVDLGLSVEEVNELVGIGDPITLVQEFREIGEFVSGKAMDNRCACWVGIRLLETLEHSPFDVYVAFTVQEEVGVRGAQTCAYNINPDIGIAVDVTLACDSPGVSPEDVITKLGEGVAIKIMDGLSISDLGLVNAMKDCAKDKGIPYQLELLPMGGTDASAIQKTRGGVRVVTLSVPCRNVHTVTEVIHPKDLQGCVDLLLEYLAP